MLVVSGPYHLCEASTRARTRSATTLLLGGQGKDRGAVLRSDVVPLSIERRRIVQFEEPLLQEILVAEQAGIERDPNGLGMTGRAAMHLGIRWGFQRPPGVPDFGIDDALDVAKDVLDAPKAATREDGHFQSAFIVSLHMTNPPCGSLRIVAEAGDRAWALVATLVHA